MATSHTPTTIEETPDSLRILMPMPRVGCILAFTGAWLLGWLVGELSVMKLLFVDGEITRWSGLFLVLWWLAWTAGGVFFGGVFLLMLNGREVVTFGPDVVRRRVEAFGRGFSWRYPLEQVTNVRLTADENGIMDFISFDATGKRIRFGTGLTETEAERSAEAIWARYPRLMPRTERLRRGEVGPSDLLAPGAAPREVTPST